MERQKPNLGTLFKPTIKKIIHSHKESTTLTDRKKEAMNKMAHKKKSVDLHKKMFKKNNLKDKIP